MNFIIPFSRSLAVSTLLIHSIFGWVASADPGISGTNVIREGRTYLAISSEERGYAFAFESQDYRVALNEIETERALDLCREAGFEALAAQPKTDLVKSPEPTEAWIVVDGQLQQENFSNVRPYIFTNNGCKRLTPGTAMVASGLGFGIGMVISFATIPVIGPGAIVAGATCFGGFCGFTSMAYTIDGKMLLPIRAAKALERFNNDKLIRMHPLPVSTKWVVKHKVFTEVLCK